MKILWLCNIVLPELSEEFGLKSTRVGGWLTGMWQELKRNESLELAICVPIIDEFRRKDGKKDNFIYYSFPFQREEDISNLQKSRFEEILEQFSPDVVHIWGTEYHHTWTMVQACNKKGLGEHVVINIQGLLSFIYPLYDFGLPKEVIFDNTYSKTISDEKEEFKTRGKLEILALKNIKYVIGRTDWDRCCVEQLSKACYFKCSEILRTIFYEDKRKWNVNNCERHSIFISQAGYPIKGLHLVLECIYRLRERYSDLKVFIAGTDLRNQTTIYARYICAEIKKFALEETVFFMGFLSDKEMYDYYLKVNVFLSSSIEENSPNSICEAMSVGTPIVSSYVGGISTMLSHRESCLLYPLTESYMMEFYIREIFDDDIMAEKLSYNAQKKSLVFNDKTVAVKQMMEIYNLIE